MSAMVEVVARAIQADLRRQGVLYEDGEDLNRLMMGTGEAADLTAVCRAAIAAMREPTEAMIDHAWAWQSREDGEHMTNIWKAMIDAALNH